MKTMLLLALPLFALSACSGAGAGSGEPPPAIEHGLKLGTYTATSINGAYRDGVVSVTLSSQEIADGIVVTQVTMADLVYKLTVDYNRSELEFISPTVAADREQVTALRALEGELAFIAQDGKSLTNAERTLHTAATLLSNAAPGELLPTAIQATGNRGWVDIGCGNSCRTLYGSSCSPYKQTGQSSDNCKGRCGAGCGSARSGSADKWTMDCAEHDYVIGPFGDTLDDASFAHSVSCGSNGSCFHASNCSSADGCDNVAGHNSGQCR